jgi:hypothetical protein
MDGDGADDVTQRLAALLNRPLPAGLTEEILQATPDADLEQTVLDYIFRTIDRSGEDAAVVVPALPEGLQMVYATWLVESEVSHGGFPQYFWNPAGEFAVEALYGYRMIGAQRHAAALETALATYIRERPQLERFRGGGTAEDFAAWAAFSALGTLDWQFWSLATAEDPHALRIHYIRAHAEEFVTE